MTGTDITKKNQFLIFYLEDDYIVEKSSFNPMLGNGAMWCKRGSPALKRFKSSRMTWPT